MTYREAYETWLKEFADDQATVDELKAIAGDEKEIEDRFYTRAVLRHGGHARRARRGHEPHEHV